jgi:hypothetical protein
MAEIDDAAKDSGTVVDLSDPNFLGKVLPDLPGLFDQKQAPIYEIKKECLVVLDANILLLPYQLNKTTLEAAGKVYKSLHAEKRLVIPVQAAREFVINRATKIGDIVAYLNKEANALKKPLTDKIGFLENEPEYNDLKVLASKIEDVHKAFRKKAFGIADLLSTEIGNDPTSKVYATLRDAIVDFPLDTDEAQKSFQEDLKRRSSLRIPPGYKDGKKVQGGPGDLLIWKTILAEGKAHNKDCIFVSAEEKPDWWVRNSGAFQPRVELIEEYRSFTGGRTVHIVVLSKLLQIFDVPQETVLNVRRAEEANTAAVLLGHENFRRRTRQRPNRPLSVLYLRLAQVNRELAMLGELDGKTESTPELHSRAQLLARRKEDLLEEIKGRAAPAVEQG